MQDWSRMDKEVIDDKQPPSIVPGDPWVTERQSEGWNLAKDVESKDTRLQFEIHNKPSWQGFQF